MLISVDPGRYMHLVLHIGPGHIGPEHNQAAAVLVKHASHDINTVQLCTCIKVIHKHAVLNQSNIAVCLVTTSRSDVAHLASIKRFPMN